MKWQLPTHLRSSPLCPAVYLWTPTLPTVSLRSVNERTLAQSLLPCLNFSFSRRGKKKKSLFQKPCTEKYYCDGPAWHWTRVCAQSAQDRKGIYYNSQVSGSGSAQLFRISAIDICGSVLLPISQGKSYPSGRKKIPNLVPPSLSLLGWQPSLNWNWGHKTYTWGCQYSCVCKRHSFTWPSALPGTSHRLERGKMTEILATTLHVEGTTLSVILSLLHVTGQSRGEFCALWRWRTQTLV